MKKLILSAATGILLAGGVLAFNAKNCPCKACECTECLCTSENKNCSEKCCEPGKTCDMPGDKCTK